MSRPGQGWGDGRGGEDDGAGDAGAAEEGCGGGAAVGERVPLGGIGKLHAAGRTRRIIGAETLINLGLPDPVCALENGAQGWHLAVTDFLGTDSACIGPDYGHQYCL